MEEVPLSADRCRPRIYRGACQRAATLGPRLFEEPGSRAADTFLAAWCHQVACGRGGGS